MATVKTVQKSHLNLSLNWSWISAFNILWIHWKILQKIRTLFRIDSKARGAQIRVHSKELPPAAHFSVADGFWPKKKSDKIWILLGGLPFFGSTNPVITYFNITCQRGWLKYNWVFNAVIKSFVNFPKTWKLLDLSCCSQFDVNFCELAYYPGICMRPSKPIAMHCRKCRNTAINQIVLEKLCQA